MTKLKSKKMSKSTFAIIIMAILMVAMLAFGGTYAYFTDTAANITASTTAGVIQLTLGEGQADVFKQENIVSNVLPGEYLFKTTEGSAVTSLTITDASNRASYIFFEFSINATLDKNAGEGTAADYTGQTATAIGGIGATGVTVEIGGTEVQASALKSVTGANGETVYYIETYEAGATETTGKYAIGTAIEIDGANVKLDAETTGNDYQRAKIDVVLKAGSIQVVGFETAQAAYNKLYNVV